MTSDPAAMRRAGILFLIGSTLLISASDAIAKLMTASVPVMQIAFCQSLAILFSTPFLARDWRVTRWLPTRRPVLHAIRSVCQLVSALCFFTGLKYLPLAEMVAIIFIGPLLVTLLSAVILKEHVGPRRWIACLVGFAGAMVVVRPGLDGSLGWTAIFPLLSTTLYSVYVICTRLTAPHERHATLMFYACLASVAVLGVSARFYWVAPEPKGWVALISIAVISATSAGFGIRAYALAPASLLAPYTYVEIVSATILGYLLFSDLPDHFTVLGALVIVGSGLYVFHRERLSSVPASDPDQNTLKD